MRRVAVDLQAREEIQENLVALVSLVMLVKRDQMDLT